MKNTRIVILYYKLSFLILFLLLKSALLLATEDVIYNLKFKQLSAPYFLPTNEVQKVYQDKDGFIWFATRNGLCQYNSVTPRHIASHRRGNRPQIQSAAQMLHPVDCFPGKKRRIHIHMKYGAFHQSSPQYYCIEYMFDCKWKVKEAVTASPTVVLFL